MTDGHAMLDVVPYTTVWHGIKKCVNWIILSNFDSKSFMPEAVWVGRVSLHNKEILKTKCTLLVPSLLYILCKGYENFHE